MAEAGQRRSWRTQPYGDGEKLPFPGKIAGSLCGGGESGLGMRIVWKAVASGLAGVALGLLATGLVLRGGMPGGVVDGPWQTSLTIGSAGGDALTRAQVALHGLFALNRGETIYYTARRDDGGEALTGDCRYRVSGRDPATRWWSITAYGADDFLIPDPGRHYSVSKNSVTRDAHGRFAATVSAAPAEGDWIRVAHAPFSLTLRLYNPEPGVAADPAHAALPSIEKVACG